MGSSSSLRLLLSLPLSEVRERDREREREGEREDLLLSRLGDRLGLLLLLLWTGGAGVETSMREMSVAEEG